jgi:hypothetical protein
MVNKIDDIFKDNFNLDRIKRFFDLKLFKNYTLIERRGLVET